MGQYYYVVSIDSEQYLHPYNFGSGLKLMEFGNDGQSVLTALAVLLADNNSGGGSLHSDDPIIGSWAGDRIVVAGDYGVPASTYDGIDAPADTTLFKHAESAFENISDTLIRVIRDAEGEWHDYNDLDLSDDGWR